MMKIAVCDDESYILDEICRVISNELTSYGDDFKIEKYTDGMSVVKDKNLLAYDVIFLDIELGDMNGVELASSIRQLGYHGNIVFITTFAEYSTLGYKVHAFRYILKSNLEEEIKECLVSLRESMVDDTVTLNGMTVFLKDVMYMSSENHKVVFHMVNEQNLQFYEKLDDVEKKMQSVDFLRVHKSFLVNLRHVTAYKKNQLVLCSAVTIPISRNRQDDVLMSVEKWRLLWSR